jgi:DNA-directed RNA polymerase subunit RPC12/RpoP
MSKIKCPYCGTTPKKGFDVVDEHIEDNDDIILTVYHCKICGKNSVRRYEFEQWEESDGTPIPIK